MLLGQCNFWTTEQLWQTPQISKVQKVQKDQKVQTTYFLKGLQKVPSGELT